MAAIFLTCSYVTERNPANLIGQSACNSRKNIKGGNLAPFQYTKASGTGVETAEQAS